MFDNPEIKKLQQDIDALSELIGTLIETSEIRHTEIMNKLELLEESIEQEVSADDIEDIKSGIEEVKESIEERLEQDE